ncbi:MAG: DUF86 domain-containing protein [Nanoarchaeota archaeon]|nr:DUF86 domain-containing protein [Nanoarchaeota archaeon]
MDRNNIRKRLVHINEKLSKLKFSIEKYEREKDKNLLYIYLKAIERDCEEIVESAVRVNQEILEFTGEIGATYRESFEKLDSLKLFSKNDILQLANTSGFRNRLAHDYMDLDEKITLESAKKICKIYPNYFLKIEDYLNSLR